MIDCEQYRGVSWVAALVSVAESGADFKEGIYLKGKYTVAAIDSKQWFGQARGLWLQEQPRRDTRKRDAIADMLQTHPRVWYSLDASLIHL